MSPDCVGAGPEVKQPRGYGRCRMAVIPDASSATLGAFVAENVEPGSTVITDAWRGHASLGALGYLHQPHSQRAAQARGDDPAKLLPGVHRLASLAQRWLLGTHQGPVEVAHLDGYLNEFVFRFNRRNSRSRGLLFYRVLKLAARHEPFRYREMIASRRPRRVRPTPPGTRGHPPSLERPPAERPWRSANLNSG